MKGTAWCTYGCVIEEEQSCREVFEAGNVARGLARDECEPQREAPEEEEGPVVGHGRGLLAAQHSEQRVSGGG